MRDYLSAEPDLVVGELRIWVHNRTEEDWLIVIAQCSSQGATVRVEGEILHLKEVEHFLRELEELERTKQGKAMLPCAEPYLGVELETADCLGHLNLTINISPDFQTQSHMFQSTIDQSYLPHIIGAGKQLMKKWASN